MRSDAEHLRTLVESLGEEAEKISTTQTLRPSAGTTFPAEEDRAPPLEPQVDSLPDLQLLETLGEGGMGLVRLARQPSLDRRVAVKTLRGEPTERTLRSLLHEARITGRLEHPNIVPVYALGADARGAPLLVMKRIDGVSWYEVLEHPERAPGIARADLEWHLGILEAVCDALRFAHSRRVVHRDVKPDNVMIGEFGEVYLMDWGIALDLGEVRSGAQRSGGADGRGRVRQQLVGTPAYMAPELALGDPSLVDERTDVYLLGATLHELLTGRPRHEGETLMQVLVSAMESAPGDYGDDVPEELASIVDRACAADPDRRFESVEAFRSALVDYQQHRGSVFVAREAAGCLTELEALLEREPSDEESERRAQDLFGECRFGFGQALRMWEGNDEARRGLRRSVELMFDHHLRQENLPAARAALAVAPEESPRREAELASLQRTLEGRAAETRRLREVQAAFDLRVGSRARSLFSLVMGLLLAGIALWVGWQESHGWIDDRLDYHLYGLARALTVVGLGSLLARKALFVNRANRRLMHVLYAALAFIAFTRIVAWLEQSPFGYVHAAEIGFYGFFGVMLGILSDRRIILAALAYPVAAVVGLEAPEHAQLALAVAHAVMGAGAAWVWWPRGDGPAPPDEDDAPPASGAG